MDAAENRSLLGEEHGSSKCCCFRIFLKIRRSKKTAIAVMFIAFMLDLLLLTVIEPILPSIMRSLSLQEVSLNDGLNNSTSTLRVTIDDVKNTTISNISVQIDAPVSAVSVGLLIGAKPLTQVVLNPFVGAIVDRKGHTVPMLLGYIVGFLSTIGFAFGQTYALLMATRCLQGFGTCLITVAGLAMLSSVYQDQEERGRAMAIAFSGMGVGLIVGFPMGSFLYQFAGRELPFLCLAGLVICGAMIRFGLMPISLNSIDGGFNQEKDQELTCMESLSVFLDGYILLAAGAYFWTFYGIGAATALGPLYMQEFFNAEQWQIGVIFCLGAIAQFIAQYCMALWSYKIGWWLASMIGLIIVALGVATFGVPTSFWLLVIPLTSYNAGIGFMLGSIPPLLGLLADIRVNSQYGAVFALADIGTNLGYFLGSAVTGFLVEELNFLISFLGTGLVIALYSLVCLALRNVPPKSASIKDKQKKSDKHASKKRHSLPCAIHGEIKRYENGYTKTEH